MNQLQKYFAFLQQSKTQKCLYWVIYILYTILSVNLSIFAPPMKIVPNEAKAESIIAGLKATHSSGDFF